MNLEQIYSTEAGKVIRKHLEMVIDDIIENNTQFKFPTLGRTQAYLQMNNLSFPIAEQIAERCLSLPVNPFISYTNLQYVINKINEFY